MRLHFWNDLQHGLVWQIFFNCVKRNNWYILQFLRLILVSTIHYGKLQQTGSFVMSSMGSFWGWKLGRACRWWGSFSSPPPSKEWQHCHRDKSVSWGSFHFLALQVPSWAQNSCFQKMPIRPFERLTNESILIQRRGEFFLIVLVLSPLSAVGEKRSHQFRKPRYE